MSHGYGWENRSQLLKSLSASLIAGFLYLILTSIPYMASSPESVIYAGLISAVGFVLSGVYEPLTPSWAISSGIFTGVPIALLSASSASTYLPSDAALTSAAYIASDGSVTINTNLLHLSNIFFMIVVFLAAYAAVYVYENREQLL